MTASKRLLSEWVARLETRLDLHPLIFGCCRALAEIARADRCSIMVLESDTEQMTVRWATGSRVKPRKGPLRFKMGEGLCGWVAQSQRPYTTSDVTQDPRFVPYRRKPPQFRPVKAFCCLPLVTEGRTVGVVNLSSFSATRHSFGWFSTDAGKRFLAKLARVILQASLIYEAEALSRRWKRRAKSAAEALAHLSHEVRTPLALVSEASEQLLEGFGGKLQEEQENRVRLIQTQAKRMLQLVTELLDLSRIESGRLPLRLERIDLRKMIREVAGHYEILVAPRRLHLEMSDPVIIYGDASRIGQVIENLLTNAVKFTPPKGLITVRLSQRGSSAQVAVTDTGMGIPKSEQRKLFEKFSQVSHASAAGARGTGLGLSIVKEIAALHGGFVKVSSTEGKGATFTVSVPVFSRLRALTEEFRQLREQASYEGQALAVQLFQPRPGSRVSLEELAALLRSHVSREDRVMESPGNGLILLSVMAPEGLPVLQKRLREVLKQDLEKVDPRDLLWGWALIPKEETALQGVLDLAARRARGEHVEQA